MNKEGVTLLELIVVFVIIAIGSVLVVPNLRPWILNYQLRSATRDIISNLRAAQMSAVSNNLNYQGFFDTGAGTYKLQRNSGGLWVDEGTAQTLPSGISIATDFGGALTFSPNSSSNSSSTV